MDAFAEWRRRDPSFAMCVDKTAAQGAIKRLKKIEQHGEENFAALSWMLERRFPQEFSLTSGGSILASTALKSLHNTLQNLGPRIPLGFNQGERCSQTTVLFERIRPNMKIAQIAPLAESVPPKLYGGTERIVSFLTEELVGLNHEVTLFASADSQTEARLVPACESALRLSRRPIIDPITHYVRLLELVFRQAHEFDILHFHIDYLHFPLTRRQLISAVTTLHGKLTIPELVPLYREYFDMPVVSISDSQRQPLPWINWIGTVYHGLPEGRYHFHDRPGDYLAFLGRVCPEKGPDRAIEIAERAGIPLKIAAKVDNGDKTYFKEEIKPLLKSSSSVEFIGEINEQEKDEFLGNALALLFPISWPEPFGLVLIEALACGTPIIAFQNGSVPEIVEHGRTGFVVDTIEKAIMAVQKIDSIDRRICRTAFEERFTARRMAQDYLAIYEKIASVKGGEPDASTQRFRRAA